MPENLCLEIKLGGQAHAAALTPAKRKEIAQKAAATRRKKQ
jgi:hypothetical protein